MANLTTPRCPHCGSESFTKSRASVSDMMWPDSRYTACHCNTCGKGFSVKYREGVLRAIHEDKHCTYYKDDLNMDDAKPIASMVEADNKILMDMAEALIESRNNPKFREMILHFMDLIGSGRENKVQ